MKDLIIADVIRILKKPSYRIMLVVAFLMEMSVTVRTRLGVWNDIAYTSNQYNMMKLAAELMLGIMIYISVYADEFTSNSMQALIGRGVSRFKLLIAKYIDCVVITVISFALYLAGMLLMGFILGAHLSGEEILFLSVRILVGIVKTIGFATVSMIVLYLTKNVAFATITDVVLTALSNMLAEPLTKLPVIKFMHFENKVFSGAVDCAASSIMLGNRAAVFTILWELVRISAVSVLISYLFFRKKELDF
ncbi:MAG: ABC transporter permease [Lachnospiraceae bacterium]|nr:ABC transporter permease [Lachnospiraceae bacterium]